MNHSFIKVLSASIEDRRGLFLAAANRMGVPIENIEKDFWVCWVLDLLFNERQTNEPRLLFKGGTSLSKAYSLISRFSEDIDITVFREDISQNMNLDELESISGKKQRKYFEGITAACQQYIKHQLKPRLEKTISSIFSDFASQEGIPIVEIDPTDRSQQTLLIRYPAINHKENKYISPTVKIEGGAKSALDPHKLTTIFPYIAHEMKSENFDVPNIITIDAERTFWDKIIILHGVRRWYDSKGVMRQNGHRFSRHYYDVYRLLQSDTGHLAKHRLDLASDCARHAKMFFNSSSLDLSSACPGTFSIVPSQNMQKILKNDYEAMSGMIFGDIPDFGTIIDSLSVLEKDLNT